MIQESDRVTASECPRHRSNVSFENLGSICQIRMSKMVRAAEWPRIEDIFREGKDASAGLGTPRFSSMFLR